ncbi:MAG TPA: head GIN domain-containing protein [Pyrinomonadaceae bacterium]|nr:head GIN domain-containing protein [Pyrinomonadaceae bacterium]
MKRTICLLALAVVMTGCGVFKAGTRGLSGSGNIKKEKREVGAFSAVDVSGAYEVEIVCQKQPGLEVEGDENILPLVETYVKNNTLYITSSRSYNVKNPIKVRVTTANLDGVSSSGASQITIDGVKNEQLAIETSGASKINAAGETKSLEIESSGASKVNVRDLKAARVKVTLSGAGQANIYASEEVNAEVSGASSVTYYGEPKVVNKQVSGASSINKG